MSPVTGSPCCFVLHRAVDPCSLQSQAMLFPSYRSDTADRAPCLRPRCSSFSSCAHRRGMPAWAVLSVTHAHAVCTHVHTHTHTYTVSICTHVTCTLTHIHTPSSSAWLGTQTRLTGFRDAPTSPLSHHTAPITLFSPQALVSVTPQQPAPSHQKTAAPWQPCALARGHCTVGPQEGNPGVGRVPCFHVLRGLDTPTAVRSAGSVMNIRSAHSPPSRLMATCLLVPLRAHITIVPRPVLGTLLHATPVHPGRVLPA